jgi:vacuole morphology and inheritance protein 14
MASCKIILPYQAPRNVNLQSRRKYLSDPIEDVRVATETLLAEFLREIRDVTVVHNRYEEHLRSKRDNDAAEQARRAENVQEKLSDVALTSAERAAFISENDGGFIHDAESIQKDDFHSETDGHDTGSKDIYFLQRDITNTTLTTAWVPGQGVKVDYAAIVEILIQQLDNQRTHSCRSVNFPTDCVIDDEIQQSTALIWLAEFLSFTHEVMVPFTPRLIPAILPNLAHHVPMIQTAAIRTNKLLQNVIQTLPSPVDGPSRSSAEKASSIRTVPVSPTPTGSNAPSRASTLGKDPSFKDESPDSVSEVPSQIPILPSLQRSRGNVSETSPRVGEMLPPPLPPSVSSRPQSPTSSTGVLQSIPALLEENDLLDYQATVNELTIQFLSEYEETRVAALKWLIMLHQKAPKKVRWLCNEYVLLELIRPLDPCHG